VENAQVAAGCGDFVAVLDELEEPDESPDEVEDPEEDEVDDESPEDPDEVVLSAAGFRLSVR
jgi:hypothetical protein